VLFADYVNLYDKNMQTVKEKTEALLIARKEMDVEVNTEKPMYKLTQDKHNEIKPLKLWHGSNICK
jgi:hypothetical protein